jgi:hypothetical protein
VHSPTPPASSTPLGQVPAARRLFFFNITGGLDPQLNCIAYCGQIAYLIVQQGDMDYIDYIEMVTLRYM